MESWKRMLLCWTSSLSSEIQTTHASKNSFLWLTDQVNTSPACFLLNSHWAVKYGLYRNGWGYTVNCTRTSRPYVLQSRRFQWLSRKTSRLSIFIYVCIQYIFIYFREVVLKLSLAMYWRFWFWYCRKHAEITHWDGKGDVNAFSEESASRFLLQCYRIWFCIWSPLSQVRNFCSGSHFSFLLLNYNVAFVAFTWAVFRGRAAGLMWRYFWKMRVRGPKYVGECENFPFMCQLHLAYLWKLRRFFSKKADKAKKA